MRADAYVVPEGGSAIVYVTVPDSSGAILARARHAIDGVEGMATLVEPADYAKYGLPRALRQQSDGGSLRHAEGRVCVHRGGR